MILVQRAAIAQVVSHLQNVASQPKGVRPLVLDGTAVQSRLQDISDDCASGIAVAAMIDGGNNALEELLRYITSPLSRDWS